MAKSQQRCQNLCLGLVAVVSCLSIAFSSFVYITLRYKEGQLGNHKSYHLVVDVVQISNCPKDLTTPLNAFYLPCFQNTNAYFTKAGNLGPLKCMDDYYEQEGGVSICNSGDGVFHLNGDKNSVVIQKPGIYRLYGQVAFKDKNNASVSVMLRINDHNFVHCHQQNLVTGSSGAPYTTCTLNGERRLREGDKVALFVPDSRRTINAFYKTTFWGIVRMAD